MSGTHRPGARGIGEIRGLPSDSAPPDRFRLYWAQIEEPRHWLGPVSARLYGYPHERLTLAGITGTNGKSTVTALLARMLEAAGRPTGVLGTLDPQATA